jgi:hypothetical protein
MNLFQAVGTWMSLMNLIHKIMSQMEILTKILVLGLQVS